jgi:hypothetical protein
MAEAREEKSLKIGYQGHLAKSEVAAYAQQAFGRSLPAGKSRSCGANGATRDRYFFGDALWLPSSLLLSRCSL